MEWTDRAVLLSVATAEKESLIIEVLTEHHGRQSCLLPQGTSSTTMLLPGCSLRLTHRSGDLGELGHATLHDVDHGLIGDSDDSVSIRIMAHVRQMLGTILEAEEPAPKAFYATRRLVLSLMAEDGRWPIYFAQWEVTLLSALGFSRTLERCRPAYHHGEAIYFSPRTGRAVTRSEAGAFLDRMIPIPRLLMGARDASLAEVRQSLELTGLFFDRFAAPSLGVGQMPGTRKRIIAALDEVKTLPRGAAQTRGELTDEEHRRRLSAMRPLMVSRRVTLAGS